MKCATCGKVLQRGTGGPACRHTPQQLRDLRTRVDKPAAVLYGAAVAYLLGVPIAFLEAS